MPSARSHVRGETHGTAPMPPGSLDYPGLAPPSPADLCERAVEAIWRSLDEHGLLDERIRGELALLLEPLTTLGFGDRPQRLINTLRLPNPIDPSHLYWLTRRLLTLVPELQATAVPGAGPADGSRRPPQLDS